MIVFKTLSYTTAIALVLASPQLAFAKGIRAETASSVKTANELIDSTKNGQGVITITSNKVDGVKTVTTDKSFADGANVTSTSIITKNSDGSTTRDTTTTQADGNTVTKQITLTPNNNSTSSISGTGQ